MIGGRAFQIHMQNIEEYLRDPRRRLTALPNLAQQEDDLEDREDSEECDEEVEASLSSLEEANQPVQLWKAYWDWLRLMVVHFEAGSTLQRFARSPYFPTNAKPLSIKILLSPDDDKQSLPYQQVLRNSKIFPDHTNTNEKIITFIDEALAAKKRYKFLSEAFNAWKQRVNVDSSTNATDAALRHLKQSKKTTVQAMYSCLGQLVPRLPSAPANSQPTTAPVNEPAVAPRSPSTPAPTIDVADIEEMEARTKFQHTIAHHVECIKTELENWVDIVIVEKGSSFLSAMKSTITGSLKKTTKTKKTEEKAKAYHCTSEIAKEIKDTIQTHLASLELMLLKDLSSY
ncbi:hypothetical protein HYPSUDRAFT_210443, partial [Hypholoma sublateritium FD-334 SS-4]